jgi:uncharacterized protein
MSRPKIIRKVADKPLISGLKPYGMSYPVKKIEAVFLLYEEYEALRLCDYEGYNQCDASMLMKVSRPTLTRICMSARNKVSTAIVEGRQLIIEGGKVEIDNEWMKCNNCYCFFVKLQHEDGCPLCGSTEVGKVQNGGEDADKEIPLNVCCGRGKKHRCQEHTNHKIYHI